MAEERLGRFVFVERERPEDEIAVELTKNVRHTFNWAEGLNRKESWTWAGTGYIHWLPKSAADQLVAAVPERFKQVGTRSWKQTGGRWVRPAEVAQ